MSNTGTKANKKARKRKTTGKKWNARKKMTEEKVTENEPKFKLEVDGS